MAFLGGGYSDNWVRRSPKTSLSLGVDSHSYWPTIASQDLSTVQMTSGSFLNIPLQCSITCLLTDWPPTIFLTRLRGNPSHHTLSSRPHPKAWSPVTPIWTEYSFCPSLTGVFMAVLCLCSPHRPVHQEWPHRECLVLGEIAWSATKVHKPLYMRRPQSMKGTIYVSSYIFSNKHSACDLVEPL